MSFSSKLYPLTTLRVITILMAGISTQALCTQSTEKTDVTQIEKNQRKYDLYDDGLKEAQILISFFSGTTDQKQQTQKFIKDTIDTMLEEFSPKILKISEDNMNRVIQGMLGVKLNKTLDQNFKILLEKGLIDGNKIQTIKTSLETEIRGTLHKKSENLLEINLEKMILFWVKRNYITPELGKTISSMFPEVIKAPLKEFREGVKVHSGLKKQQEQLETLLEKIKAKFIKLDESLLTPEHIEELGIRLSGLEDLANGFNYGERVLKIFGDFYDSIIVDDDFQKLKEQFVKNDYIFFSQGDLGRVNIPTNIHGIIPLYSKTGAVGYNTIIHCYLNGFIPIGIGVTPFPAHGASKQKSLISMLQHEYVHGEDYFKLVKESPQSVKIYQRLYDEIPKLKDETAQKRYLLTLFTLLHELEFNLEQNDPTDALLKNIERLMPTINIDVHSQEMHDKEMMYPGQQKPSAGKAIVKDSYDFVLPLRSLGFKIFTDEQGKEILLKTANNKRDAGLTVEEAININKGVKDALLVLWKELTGAYPELLLKK